MRQRLTAFAVSLGVLTIASPVMATTLFNRVYTCPVGGKTFEAAAYGSYFGYGNRPDGRPMGTGRGWVAIPECPDNHLLLYRDFSPPEIATLKYLIASSEYLGLVKTDTPFFRAAWLEKKLNPQSPQHVWYLLTATWYVGKDEDKKARYRQAFLDVAEPVAVNPEDMRSLILRLRVLNVYRETGQFERTLQNLDQLPVEAIASGLPQTQEEAWKLDEKGQERWYFVQQARQLRTLTLRQDASVNPIDVLPDWMAQEECYFRSPKTAFETAFCSTPEMLKVLAEDKEMYEAEREYWDYRAGPGDLDRVISG